ncbi:MAG: ComEC/Rec2 family competence protein, partial [Bacteroidales bacterium]
MYIHQAQIPLVRIAIPFIAGILLSITTGLKINGPVFYSTSLSLLLLLFLINKYATDYKYKNLYGIALCVLLLLLGMKICQQYNQLENPNHFSYYGNRDDYALLQLTSPVSEKPNSFQLKAKVTSIANDSMCNSVSGNIIIYLEKCPDAEKLKYGDIIITKNDFQETRPPSNPNEFNYKRFLAYSNIHHQAYRRSDDWQFTGKNSGNHFIKATHKLRDKSLEILKSNNISGKEYAVASALVLGYREYLDDELRQGFAGAGAMHVLCVSGLHVGIIFLILNTVFGFLTKIKRGEIIKALIIILIIWLYAAITGFSPSVQRASTMFTFMAIGSSIKRKTNIYNTLAASALFLLIINPYLITKIGFQLSYLAVIGIVALQPAFYKHIIFKNKILDKAWAIITVSVAAQLATGPLGIYYFNQFPNYFILTNLAVIPLASLIIYAALFVIILSPIHILASLFGRILSFCVKILNYIV